jgi:hypothetical protein
MKRTGFLILCAIACVFMLPSSAKASEACGELYTYSDMWVADDGNIVADNYTDAEPCGAYYTTFADITVSMPSGSSYYGSGSGFSSFAEALAEATASNESGDGELNLYSEIVYTCGESLFASSVSFIRFGTSFTWFRFASGTTFDKMTPCPEPGHTISCIRDHVVFADARDILGVYVEMTHPWVRVFGVLVCSPTWTIFNQQTIAPERPYCYDIP